METMIKLFGLEGINTASPIFNQKKLDWFNRQHIQQKPAGELRDIIIEYTRAYHPEINEHYVSEGLAAPYHAWEIFNFRRQGC